MPLLLTSRAMFHDIFRNIVRLICVYISSRENCKRVKIADCSLRMRVTRNNIVDEVFHGANPLISGGKIHWLVLTDVVGSSITILPASASWIDARIICLQFIRILFALENFVFKDETFGTHVKKYGE